jgi:hypothetical protein
VKPSPQPGEADAPRGEGLVEWRMYWPLFLGFAVLLVAFYWLLAPTDAVVSIPLGR